MQDWTTEWVAPRDIQRALSCWIGFVTKDDAMVTMNVELAKDEDRFAQLLVVLTSLSDEMDPTPEMEAMMLEPDRLSIVAAKCARDQMKWDLRARIAAN